jgi:transcriptional regulator with XRE-family HTH domain
MVTPVKFNVEKTSTGYSAYREEKNGMILTTGSNLEELRKNILEAYNLHQEERGKNHIEYRLVSLQFDLSSFFEFYPEINTSALGARIGMHKSLLSEYINGKRKPSDKQIHKILLGVKELGKELTQLEIV